MQTQRLSFKAIGTHWTIQAETDMSAADWLALDNQIHLRIDEFDRAYSRFRDDSLVAQMSQQSGTFPLPADGYELVSFYSKLNMLSNGQVTPLIGQVVSDAGYDAEYSLKPGKLYSPPDWDEVLSYDATSITLSRPALLDFGAAGKGYLVDIVADIVGVAGITTFFVNAGGDILYRTDSSARLNVGLENPQDHSEVVGTASIINQSICASSGSRRQWGEYHHIINPNTLESPVDIIATWTVADRAVVADGLATALYFVGAGELRRQFDFAWAVLRSDMSLEYSPDFPTILNKFSI